MPEESAYSEFSASKKQAHEDIKRSVEENVQRGQEKQMAAYAKKLQKKYKEVQYKAGDEILLLNARRRARKGGRLQADFSGPYRITDISGKHVTLESDGKTLHTKYSIDHIKPYRRPEREDLNAETLEDVPKPPRPSVITSAKKAEATQVKIPPETPNSTQDEGGLL